MKQTVLLGCDSSSSSSSESRAVSQLSLRDRKQSLPPSLPPSLPGLTYGQQVLSVRDAHAITTLQQLICLWEREHLVTDLQCAYSGSVWRNLNKNNRVILQVRVRTVRLGLWLNAMNTHRQQRASALCDTLGVGSDLLLYLELPAQIRLIYKIPLAWTSN